MFWIIPCRHCGTRYSVCHTLYDPLAAEVCSRACAEAAGVRHRARAGEREHREPERRHPS